MFQGKTKVALRLLTEQAKGGVLRLGDRVDEQRTVRDVFTEKHPPSQPLCRDSIIDEASPDVHPVLFESIDASLIRSAALQTSGAAGPSGLDAPAWRRLCTSFKSVSMIYPFFFHSVSLLVIFYFEYSSKYQLRNRKPFYCLYFLNHVMRRRL